MARTSFDILLTLPSLPTLENDQNHAQNGDCTQAREILNMQVQWTAVDEKTTVHSKNTARFDVNKVMQLAVHPLEAQLQLAPLTVTSLVNLLLHL
jgi:hypothetical protein